MDTPPPDTFPETAPALWQVAPGAAALRATPVAPGRDDLIIRTLYSGISRGTESLVLAGAVPVAERARMRAPLQEGDFPFPVKYGYSAVGRVIAGPPERLGTTVFALGPHQAVFACPAGMAHPLPAALPPARAVLAANMETALNITWDAGAAPGDRIAVVGAGVVGALVGYLCARLPGAEVTLFDTNPARAALAAQLGCAFAAPDAAAQDRLSGQADVVIHASASPEGLALALALAGREATVVEASWYGDRAVPVPLGGAFHSQRLRLVSSQVGRLPPARAPRWDYARRLRKALDLLCDPALDALISGETALDDLAPAYPRILADPATLCHRVRHS
jgi:threonine dehydrogenase-like Zn-dependent dehydrogenase